MPTDTKDVLLLKDQFQEQAKQLRDKIDEETLRLSSKVDESQKSALEKVETLFDRKFLTVAGAIVGLLTMIYGGVTFLQDQGVTGSALGWVTLIGGLGILLVVYLLASRRT